MSQIISAVYENGVLILEEPLAVSEGSKVEIVVVAKEQKRKRTPAQILADLAALPMEGKTDKFSGRDHDRMLYGEDRKK
ncbi:MAG: antitoxin family protein [Pyrinomonadaceae bacterium]